MTAQSASATRLLASARPTFQDYYAGMLVGLLFGYAIFGKYFAYLGIPPLYVGDITLLLGMIVFLRSGCAIATLTSGPSLILLFFVGWIILRTLPFLREFGIDALRDSVIAIYGAFAFVVLGLLLEAPARLLEVPRFLRPLGAIIIFIAPVLLIIRVVMSTGSDWDLGLNIKAGSLAVQLAGAAIMMLLGFSRAGIVRVTFLLTGVMLASIENRGGMLAFLLPVSFAFLLTGKIRQLAVGACVASILFGLFYVSDVSIPVADNSRELSARQLIDNGISLIGQSQSDSNVDATKEWRLAWWDSIINYTFHGPYFWTGKGFGMNLAVTDGFVVGQENPGLPLLRSPHNANFSILARSGVPGLALWVALLGTWTGMLLTNMLRARLRHEGTWAGVFLLILCYASGFVINASFDVSLEGPMDGIWFWCLFGLGIGATMIYRADAISDVALQRHFQIPPAVARP